MHIPHNALIDRSPQSVRAAQSVVPSGNRRRILGAFGDAIGGLTAILYLIYVIAMIVPSIAVAVRRLHDTDKSGALFLLLLVPFIGSIILFVFYLSDEDRTANRSGPSPKYQA